MMAEAAESSTAVKVLVVKVCQRQRFLLKHQACGWPKTEKKVVTTENKSMNNKNKMRNAFMTFSSDTEEQS